MHINLLRPARGNLQDHRHKKSSRHMKHRGGRQRQGEREREREREAHALGMYRARGPANHTVNQDLPTGRDPEQVHAQAIDLLPNLQGFCLAGEF